MKNERKSLFVIVTILAVAVLGLSIAYAALSTTLTARLGTVTQSPQLWEVGFEPGTVAGQKSGTSTEDITCSNATVTQSQASVDGIALAKPGDTCTYQLKIKNTGTIDANLSLITPTQPDGVTCNASGANMVCGDLTYKLTTDQAGSNILTANRLLEKSTGELTVYLIATYSGTNVSSGSVTHTGVQFTLTYNQA